MCFSAPASFAASAFLLGVGTVALSLTKTSAQRPLAAIPLLFAIQQAIEGFVWLSFDNGDPATARALAQAYVLFSHVLWPAYVPMASWQAEPAGPRRRVLGGVAVAGLLVSMVLAWSLSVDPVMPELEGSHIAYRSSLQMLGPATVLIYLIATTGSLIASSQGFIRLFGVLVLAAFLLAYGAYARWFISVWCFFAAWLSVVLVLRFAVQRRQQVAVLPTAI